MQLIAGGYDECSVLRLPRSLEEWEDGHRTARKRAWRSTRLGYTFAAIERSAYAGDVYAINTSLAHRQGRPMTAGYWERPSSEPEQRSECRRHGVHAYGVLREDELVGRALVAYAWIYRSGELALVSQILGHGGHLHADVMYLLARGVIEAELELGGALVYNRHDSGTDGLRYYKERIGFEPREVAWTA